MANKYPSSGILVEAETFDNFGGWIIDSQFELEMGSPYLLAHGNGEPVKDATTTITLPKSGEYNVWVRAKDWVPGYHPGMFTLSIGGLPMETQLGANDRDWFWQSGGRATLSVGETTLTLHDLTGFGARCDAIFLSTEDTPPPNGVDKEVWRWRQRIRGLPEAPAHVEECDVVVVGGGIPGSAAALPGGWLRPRGVKGPLIEEITERHPNGDLYARQLLEADPKASIFLEHTVYDTVTAESRIVSVDVRNQRTGVLTRFTASIFIDCSGRAILGLLSGAETLFGQAGQDIYGEGHAPAHTNTNHHHGNTVFFRTTTGSASSFPPVPWATEVAKDYANLGGQLIGPGLDNGEGPAIADPSKPRPKDKKMSWPCTHFWEYGQHLDPYKNMEHIRDHLLRAIYGTFSNVKNGEPDKYALLELEWVAYVAATGEFKRYRGDYVLTENDIRSHKYFPDAVVQNDSAFCIHHPGDENYDFRLRGWTWDERDGKPYDIPFRCLYSKNISNLMMAGKHISVTHVAGSNTKFMGNGGQHAIATAAAAHLCNQYGITPRRLCEKRMGELRTLVRTVTEPQVGSKL